MTLPLTREMIKRAYDYLRVTPPFNGWNLPEPEDVVFRVTRSKIERGHFINVEGGKPIIAVSSGCIGRTESLFETLAHEMIPQHEAQARMEGYAEHGRVFQKLAERVCRVHGFDPRLF